MNRIQIVLEGANIKLSSVASDTLSKSGRAMLEGMIQGEENPEVLSELAKGRMKAKKVELRKALQGLMGAHQRMMLATQLLHIDYLDEEIAWLDKEIKKRMRPFEEDLEMLETIPGVGRRTAEQVLGRLGRIWTNSRRPFIYAHGQDWLQGTTKVRGNESRARLVRGTKNLGLPW